MADDPGSSAAVRALTRDILPDDPARRRHRRHVHRRGARGRRPAFHGEDPDHGAGAGGRRAHRFALGDRRGGHRAPRGGLDHPRDHARHQRADRAHGRQDRPSHHRRVPRRRRDPARKPLRAVRRQHRPAAAAGSSPAALPGPRADRRARPSAGPPRRRQRRPRHRGARRRASRRGGGRAPAQLHQSGPRAPDRRGDRAGAARRRGDAFLRGLAGDARIRALLHRLRQCVHPAAYRALPCEARARARPRRLSLPLAADDLGRRDHDHRDRHPLSGSPGRIGAAGGAIFASCIARQHGLDQVLSFDMGGTTAKICLIDKAQPQTARAFEVARIYRFLKGSGLPLRIPVIEMVEIGAGGGSIARVDALGRIVVGPDSAGSEPGPVCYARGGSEPTVTDADVVLGRIDPATFSGGRIPLDVAGARRAAAERIGAALNLATEHAALGISELVDENMANAARVHAIESGKDLRPRTLIAFGGAAPLHAARVADKLGISRVLVPANAGVGSAVGLLRAPVAYEIVRGRLMRLQSFDAASANRLVAGMRAAAEAIVRSGAPAADLVEQRSAFMRYRGQGHEIAVELPARDFTAADRSTIGELFETAYRRLYSRAIPGVDIEILSWVVAVSAPGEGSLAAPAPERPAEPKPRSRRGVFYPDSGAFRDVPIYWRGDLAPGAHIRGPAVIAEDETSTVVSPLFDARMDRFGYIELTRREA